MKYGLPKEILNIMNSLSAAGYEAYAVGGAVRDLLLGKEPQDWDVATNARPAEIQKIFPDSVYENSFGTVGIKVRHEDETEVIEVTTYRSERGYSDARHPDEVKFVQTLEEDLSRRDFTVNALAMGETGEIKDPFKGQEDLEKKIIRAVGDADKRFGEDALRLIRAVRFAAQLGFEIEQQTRKALVENADSLKNISLERIRDEFVKIIMSAQAEQGVRLLQEFGLLRIFLPELEEGFGVAQNKHHIYEVFDHNVRALAYAVKQSYGLEVRLASLFHDIGKPRSKHGAGEDATFYNHEMIGAKMVRSIMKRLSFSKTVSDKVTLLVRHHQFYYTPEEVTAASVRRLIANVGLENIHELLQVREADRIGSGVPKAVPYKLRHLKYMVEKVSTDPISPKMLKINGHELMQELGLKPSKKLGLIINSLLAEVIEYPQLNKHDELLDRARELDKMSDQELAQNLATIAKAVQAQEEEMKRKYYVK